MILPLCFALALIKGGGHPFEHSAQRVSIMPKIYVYISYVKRTNEKYLVDLLIFILYIEYYLDVMISFNTCTNI